MPDESSKMTVFDIYRAICKETVRIWYEPEKQGLLGYADSLDDMNKELEKHALQDTYPSASEWKSFLSKLKWFAKIDSDLVSVLEDAQKLAAHPELFDAAENEKKRKDYFR